MPEDWPVLHLEDVFPHWTELRTDGLVLHPRRLGLEELEALGAEHRTIAVHCVWGWSRPVVEWTGVGMDVVLDLAGVEPTGTHVVVSSASDHYSSCLPLADAAHGLLAWARDGARLSPVAGGPLRFVGPPEHWAYKGVKWAARVSVVDRFVPGFWESRVADPLGRIPSEVELP